MFRILPIFHISLAVLFSGSIPGSCKVLELSSIGIVGPKKSLVQRRINELFCCDNRLYIGQGDAVLNTGPTDVVYYDFTQKKFFSEFTVDEEAIYRYQEIDGRLTIPGVKSADNNRFGRFYIRTDTGWIKIQTIPNSIHINSLVRFQNRLFAGVDAFSEVGNDQRFFFGAIYVSSDSGKTWLISNTTPSSDKIIYRIGAIVKYKDKLYAFPYAYSPLKLNQIPVQYHQDLSRCPYNDHYLILIPDILGKNDVLVYDGKLWRMDDIVEQDGLCCIIRPFVFSEKLILPAVSGEFVDYLNLSNKMPARAQLKFFVYDGNRSHPLKFNCDRLYDVVIREDNLYLLIEKAKQKYIVQTGDLKNWNYFLLPPIIKNPGAIEFYNNHFYIGTADGNIFESTGCKKITNLKQAEDVMPVKIYGSAQLPREGLFYWVAISGWASWTAPAWFSAEIKYGNLLEFYTRNLIQLNIFLPRAYLDTDRNLIVIIDSQLVYEGGINQTKEIICSKIEENGEIFWMTDKGNGTREEYKYQKIYIGRAEIALQGDMLSNWKASVIKEETDADLVIISPSGCKTELKKGNIYLEDVYDISYRDTVYLFKARGKILKKILQYILNLDNSEKLGISGGGLKIDKIKDKNKVVESAIVPEKEYRAAIENRLAKRIREYFDKEIEIQDDNYAVYELLLQWLTRNKIIKE